MVRKPKRRSKAEIKAAADRASARSKGEKPSTALVPIDPEITKAAEIAAEISKRSTGYKALRGRPTVYDEEIAAEIAFRLAEGESLSSICRDDHMPAKSTVTKWGLDEEHPFFEQYTRARTLGIYSRVDQIHDIAADARNDWMERHGFTVENPEPARRSKLRVDAIIWESAKMLPKIYGPKKPDDNQDKGADLAAFRSLWEMISEGAKPAKAVVDATFEEVKS